MDITFKLDPIFIINEDRTELEYSFSNNRFPLKKAYEKYFFDPATYKCTGYNIIGFTDDIGNHYQPDPLSVDLVEADYFSIVAIDEKCTGMTNDLNTFCNGSDLE